MVFGTFDIIHPGHIHMLKQAKAYGDYLIVVVARDKTVCAFKNKPAINNETKRIENLKKLGLANRVVLGCLDDKHQIVRDERPDIVALGYDQRLFIDKLEDALPDNSHIVRLTAFHPEKYKSSKLIAQLLNITLG